MMGKWNSWRVMCNKVNGKGNYFNNRLHLAL
jgi:hypothetical protein